MQFHDRMAIGAKRKLADGRMVVDARFARAGIYVYSGREVDPDNASGMRDKAAVRVYRPPSEVFAPDSMASFAHKAVTDDHPPAMVDAANWQEFAKGWTEGGVGGDGHFVHVPMMLADGGLVAKVDDGTKELSAGYDAEINFELGFTPLGEAYDAIMRTIRGNHIAVVDRGRAGPECSIADSDFEGADTMTNPAVATKAFVYDGISIVVTDQAEQVIVKLQAALADSKAAAETAATAHSDAIAAKDTELGTKDAEIADLRSKALTDEALDAKVAERAALLADVFKVADGIDVKGKSVADIRRAAVIKALGDNGTGLVDGKSDDYVAALFDAMVARAGDGTQARPANDREGDGLAAVLADALPGGNGNGPVTDSGKAYQAMLDRRRKAWEQPGEDKAAA